jgi:hypothetical protein
MTRPPGDTSSTGELAGLGAGALVLLCCAAPVLLAVGLAAGLGASPRNPWLIGIGCAVVLAVIVCKATRIARHHRSRYADDCSPPRDRTADRVAAALAIDRSPR